MRRLGILGGRGLLIVAVLLVLVAQAAPVHPSRRATIAGHWDLRLETYGPYADLASAPVSVSPQGQLVLVRLRVQNIGDAPESFNPADVFIETSNKGSYFPSAQTSAVDATFQNSEPLAPQAVAEHSLAFDVDPASTGPVLHVLEILFPLPNLLQSG